MPISAKKSKKEKNKPVQSAAIQPAAVQQATAQPAKQRTAMDPLREHLAMLSGDSGLASLVKKDDLKLGYVILTNAVLEQCNVNKESFEAALQFKSDDKNDSEILMDLLSKLSQMQKIEKNIVLEATSKGDKSNTRTATIEALQNALDNIVGRLGDSTMTPWQETRLNLLKKMNCATDGPGFFVCATAMLSEMINQVYIKNIKAGNIEPKPMAEAGAKATGVYSAEYHISTLANMLRDVSDKYIAQNPEVNDETPYVKPEAKETPEVREVEKPEIKKTPEELEAEEKENARLELESKAKAAAELRAKEELEFARKRSRRYIRTASFEKDGKAPEDWYLAPFTDAVMELMNDNLAYAGKENLEKLFKAKVCVINTRVQTAMYSVEKMVKSASGKHSYLSNENIAEIIKNKVSKVLTSDSEVLKEENDDSISIEGTSTGEGKTTDRIRASVDGFAADMDKKLDEFFVTAESHLPQLELCRENMKKSPELMAIVFNDELNDRQKLYYDAKNLLKQADKNIGVLEEVVDADSEMMGDIPFLKRLIEQYGNDLFTTNEEIVRSTTKINLNELKRDYSNSAAGKNRLSKKMSDKFGDDLLMKRELRVRISRLPPQTVTDEMIDRQIEKLLQNKRRNVAVLNAVSAKYYYPGVKDAEKLLYKEELVRIMQKHLPLDESNFTDKLSVAKSLLRGKTPQQLMGNTIPELPAEKPQKEAVKPKEDEEKRIKRQAFNSRHKAAIINMTEDYSQNLLHGFSYTALRLNNDSGEATSSREGRIAEGTAQKDMFRGKMKASPEAGEKDKRSIVEREGAPISLIDFTACFRAAAMASKGKTVGGEEIYQLMLQIQRGKNLTFSQYVERLHTLDRGKKSGEQSGLVEITDKFCGDAKGIIKNAKEEYKEYLIAIGAKDIKDNYCYYDIEDYRIQIEELMGDDFGKKSKEDFEEKLIEIEVATGVAIGDARDTPAGDNKLFRRTLVTDAKGNGNGGEISQETMDLLKASDQSLAGLSQTLDTRIKDILQRTGGDLKLLVPYLVRNEKIYQTLLGSDSEYNEFTESYLPVICTRMRKLQMILSKVHEYLIAMTLKMQLPKAMEEDKTVSDVILSQPSDNEKTKLGVIEQCAIELENQKISKIDKNGNAINGGKSAVDKVSELIEQAAGQGASATDNVGIQGLLMSGKLDGILLNKKALNKEIKTQLKSATENGKAVMECKSYKAQVEEYRQRVEDVTKEKELIYKPMNDGTYGKMSPEDKENLAAKCGAVNTKLQWAENAEPTLKFRIMVYFGDDLFTEDTTGFKAKVDQRVSDFMEEQRKAREESEKAEALAAKIRERSAVLRSGILAGEAELEKQQSMGSIVRYIDKKRISAVNEVKLSAKINEIYNKKMTEAQKKRTDTTIKKDVMLGNVGHKSETEAKEDKAMREKALAEAMSSVTEGFLNDNKQSKREKALVPMKNYIAAHEGGESEAVQNIVAEFLFEKDTDATGEESHRQFDAVETKFTATDALIGAIRARSDNLAKERELTVADNAEGRTLAEAQQREEEINQLEDNLADAATSEEEKKEQEKEENDEQTARNKAAKKAARRITWRTQTLNPIIKAVGEIHRLLEVCFEAVEVGQNQVEWALSSIMMKYGDKLTELKDDALVGAVYSLANEFKVKLITFETFTAMKEMAQQNPDTYAEYNDRVHIMSIELGSMDMEDFCNTCKAACQDFSLYCYSYALIKESVEEHAQRYSENGEAVTDEQKCKAVLSLVRIMRGRTAGGAVQDKAALTAAVEEHLDDPMTFQLLTQSGYSSEGVGNDSVKAEDQSIYSVRDLATFENFLSMDKKVFTYYKALSERDRAMFFAVLGNSTMWQNAAKSSAVSSTIISRYATMGNDEDECGQVIMNYANGEEIAYTPSDYSYAIDALITSGLIKDAKVDRGLFDSVKKIMNELREVRRAHRPVNSEVIDYSHEQVIAMVDAARKGETDSYLDSQPLLEAAQGVTGQATFVDYLEKLSVVSKKQVKQAASGKLEKQYKKYFDKLLRLSHSKNSNRQRQFFTLIGILQNRSMVDVDRRGGGLLSKIRDIYEDYSKLNKHYANEEVRSDFADNFSEIGTAAITKLLADGSIWKQAALSLISYQVSGYNEIDDAEKITGDDIVGAKRSINLDLNMLGHAFVLLDKITKQKNQNIIMGDYSVDDKNEKAKALYEKYNTEAYEEITGEQFEEFVDSQKTDKKMDSEMKWSARGYFMLPPAEKNLFCAILSDRKMVDLTKVGIWKERMGSSDEARQQMNQEGRMELMEEYVSRGKVEINSATAKKALNSLLTSQLNDDKASENKKVHSERKTAVDWKLFARALEFVHLCHSARENYIQRRKLEQVLMGGDSPTGYREELDLYGSNEQRAGNRFTHTGGRVVKQIGLSMVSDSVRNGLVRLACTVVDDPDTAKSIAGAGLLTDSEQEKIDGSREELEKSGKLKGGAKLTNEAMANIFSQGQQTIFGKMKDAANGGIAEQIKEKFSDDEIEDTAESAVESIGSAVGKVENVDFKKVAVAGKAKSNVISGVLAAAKNYGEQNDAAEEKRKQLKELAKITGTEVDDLLSEKIGDTSGQVKDVVGFIKDSKQLYKLHKLQKQSNSVHANENIDKNITLLAEKGGTDAGAAIAGKDKAMLGAASGLKFAQSGKAQSMVEHAINFIGSFAELSEGIDPTKLLAKLVEGGFTALAAAINGIINYCTSIKNMHDFIRLGDFDSQILKLSAMKNSDITPEEANKIINQPEKQKKDIWINMHGMDKGDAINYVGKETVYALKFCVSNACRMPYLRSMGMLIFATLGFGVAGGKVMASDSEIFDKLLGSR